MSKTLYFTVEGAIILAGFVVTVVWFHSGEFLTRSNSLMPFWFLPVIFGGLALLFKRLATAGIEIHWLFHYIFYSIAGGVWLGLSLESILVLNEWYQSSGSNGRLEPLFTATGLSTAAILTAQRIVGKISGRKEEEEDEDDDKEDDDGEGDDGEGEDEASDEDDPATKEVSVRKNLPPAGSDP